MKRYIKYFCALSLLMVSLLLFAGCSSEKDDTNKPAGTEAVYYTVKFNSNGGSAISEITLKKDSLIKRPDDPTYQGYVFAGWYDGKAEWLFDEYTVTKDMTLQAKWINAKDVYSYELNGDGTATITGVKTERVELSVPSAIEGNTVVGIGERAFYGLDPEKVLRIIIPETVKVVEASAFEDCADITVTVEGKLTSIGEKAFSGCNKLESVGFGEGLKSIPYQAFAGCAALEEIFLPDSLTLIDENGFEECEGLVRIVLGSGIETVSDGAFRFCNAVKVVFYHGTDESEYEKITIAAGNDVLKNANLYIYSAEMPAENAEGYWHYDDKGDPKVYG